MFQRHKTAWEVALFCAIIVALPVGMHFQAVWQLHRCRQKWIAAGEKLDMEHWAGLPPLSSQTAQYLGLAQSLQVTPALYLPLMHETRPGGAEVTWRQAVVVMDAGKPPTNIWPVLSKAFDHDRSKLDRLQQLIDSGKVRVVDQINLKNPFSTLLPYVAALKGLPINFAVRSILELHEGNTEGAFADLRESAAAAGVSDGEFITSQLVRDAATTVSMGAVWEALQTNVWTDEQLADLQEYWAKLDFLDGAVESLELHRAAQLVEMDIDRRDSSQSANGFLTFQNVFDDYLLDSKKGLRELYDWFPGYWGWKWVASYRQETQFLDFMQTKIDFLRAVKAQRLAGFPKLRYNKSVFPDSGGRLDVLVQLKPIMENFTFRTLRTQTEDGMAVTALALERYRKANGGYPHKLTELMPRFLPAIPVDYMDGHPLRYRLNGDGTYTLYSVGEDGVDDGGDATPRDGHEPSFYFGRDWVWPRALNGP